MKVGGRTAISIPKASSPGHKPQNRTAKFDGFQMADRRPTGGGGISRQVKFAVANFAVGNFTGPHGLSVVPPRQSPQCGLLVCEKFAENPEFRVGNFAVNVKREIEMPRNPPPPPPYCCSDKGVVLATTPFCVVPPCDPYRAVTQTKTH